MKRYPSWRTNLFVFTLVIVLLGGYFFRQTQQATRELQKHSREHSEILAAVVELNIRNTLLSRKGLEESVAASLENSARFIHYLDSIEAFSADELTAFALESGLAGVRIVQADTGVAVSGPDYWLQDRECPDGFGLGLERLSDEQLYLFSFLPEESASVVSRPGCVLVGLSAEKIDVILDKISVERLLTMFDDLHDIAYVRFEADGSKGTQSILSPSQMDHGDIMETRISMGDKQLVVALKTDRFGKRRRQMQKEFVIFISLLILFGAFSSWWLYRVQHQRLKQTREFERKMGRQHEDAALGRAAATITHELRNPLNAIGMGLQRLQIEGDTLDPEQKELLVSMRNAVDRSNTIITRLKQYVHSFEVSSQPVNVSELLIQTLTLYRSQCEEQQIDIELECDHDSVIHGDKVLLGQLFENLLKNSVEAQLQGGFLKIAIGQFEKQCRVEIENGGFSLSREESKLLFEPYFTRKSKGTGLGLVISRKIVQAHRGQLTWYADYDKKRIHFLITLPVGELSGA
jgi:two-component system, NtrC family, sensor histidine kinase HydH